MWIDALSEPAVTIGLVTGSACLILAAWSMAIDRNERVARKNLVETERSFLQDAQARATSARKSRDPGKLSRLLASAGIESSAFKWFGQFLLGGFAAAAIMVMLDASDVLVFAAFAAAIALSFSIPVSKAGKNERLFAEQLAQALPQIAENTRCGLSPESAVRAVSSHMDDPLREEFRQLNSEIAYGSSLAEAFEAMAARTGSSDIKLVATVVAVQAARGGKLSDTFDMVAETVAARIDLRRHVRIITAESRTSMWVVTVLPWLFLVFMGLADSSVFEFYGTAAGTLVFAAAIALELIGIAAMARIGKIETT